MDKNVGSLAVELKLENFSLKVAPFECVVEQVLVVCGRDLPVADVADG